MEFGREYDLLIIIKKHLKKLKPGKTVFLDLIFLFILPDFIIIIISIIIYNKPYSPPNSITQLISNFQNSRMSVFRTINHYVYKSEFCAFRPKPWIKIGDQQIHIYNLSRGSDFQTGNR
jgi:hypothetical protein